MMSGGMSAPSGAESGGLKRERGGRPLPRVWWEARPSAPDRARPTRIHRPSSKPTDSVNVKGAFPLLLIGSVAVAYSIVLALQSADLTGHRLPIWALVSLAGATILGAGVFSLFWAEVEEDETKTEGKPKVVEAIEPKVLTRREESISPVRRSSAPPPPWWEGPPTDSAPAAGHLTAPTVSRSQAGSAPVPVNSAALPSRSTQPASRRSGEDAPGLASLGSPAGARARVPPNATQAPSALRRGFPKEFMDSLAELETVADRELKLSPRSPPKPIPGESRTCADCKRVIPNHRPPNRCSGCGRGLCVDCAKSSQLEDAELRCIECRVRGPFAQ
jgi:hypothetical protein